MGTEVEQKKSPAARVTVTHQRAIFALLEEHFDVEQCDYVGGWSDLRIAQEVGCTPAAVVYRREGAFGKLKKLLTKLTLADLRDAVDIVVERLSWIEEDCQKNFEGMHKLNVDMTERIAAIEKTTIGIGTRITDLSVKVDLHEATLVQGGADVMDLAKKIVDLGGTIQVMTDTMGVITDEIALPGEVTIASAVEVLGKEVAELKSKLATYGVKPAGA